MGDVTLLPCPNPWCPSAPKVISIGTTKYPALFPVCTICKAQPRGTWSTEEAAIAAWNDRPAPSLTPAQQAAEETCEALASWVEYEGSIAPSCSWDELQAKVTTALANAGWQRPQESGK